MGENKLKKRCLTVLRRSLLGARLYPARAGPRPVAIGSGTSLLLLLYEYSLPCSKYVCSSLLSSMDPGIIMYLYYYPAINIPLFLCEKPQPFVLHSDGIPVSFNFLRTRFHPNTRLRSQSGKDIILFVLTID